MTNTTVSSLTDVQLVRVHIEVLGRETVPNSGLADIVKKHGLHTQAQEAFWVISNDINGNLHRIAEVARGRHDTVDVDIPSLLTAVLATGAPRFSIAHNHPTMTALPSYADRQLTNDVIAAANACGLIFEDHVIVDSTGDSFSFVAAGYVKQGRYARKTTKAAGGTR